MFNVTHRSRIHVKGVHQKYDLLMFNFKFYLLYQFKTTSYREEKCVMPQGIVQIFHFFSSLTMRQTGR